MPHSRATGHTGHVPRRFPTRFNAVWRCCIPIGPRSSNRTFGMARCACSVEASRHQPLPDEASCRAGFSYTPFSRGKAAMVLGSCSV